MKTFNGKAIYNPSGKAGEYSYWACNFYVGCSNGCTYCYCKKGILAGAMGQDKPQLKKCFKDEKHALEVFEKELLQNKTELQKHGIFFSFTTDPAIEETWYLTGCAINICRLHDVPFSVLTKSAKWLVDEFIYELQNNGTIWNREPKIHLWSFGFTLTGHDELEPNASTNLERIETMKKLHNAGFKTFASIEPIIDFDASYEMIQKLSLTFSCDLFKIGLLSGKKYDLTLLRRFINHVTWLVDETPIYFKDTLLKQAGIERKELPENCVNRDYKLHEAHVHVA